MEVLERLPVDEPGERVRGLGHAGSQQSADLVEQPLLELRVDAPRDALGRLLRRESRSAKAVTS